MLIDLDRCIGCHACQVTCKAEYNIPFGAFRCRVETYRSGGYPQIKKVFLPRLCNHCDTAPCIEECKEKALYKNQDGVVILNGSGCIGCKMCEDKCPYNAIEISPSTGQAEKCDFCYERITRGLQPVCAQSCMGRAMLFGDINDPKSEISAELSKHQLKVLNPELGTNPSVFYIFKGDVCNAPLKDYTIPSDTKSTRRIKVKKSPEQTEGTLKSRYSSCAMCPSECGISVLVDNGIAKKIYGSPHTLVNNGAFCAKGASGLQLTYSPHRIKTPLIRTGERGEDKWKEITWEEASDYIAKKLLEIKNRYGAESVFLDCGDVTDREAYYRLFHAFGTPNTYNHGSICDPNRRWGQGLMLGDERPLPDVQRPLLIRDDDGGLHLKREHDAKLILNLGANPFVATRFNYMSRGIPAAKENGCMYIVIDPAYTNSAAHADIWLPITPGTDAALLAAMLHYIIQNDPEQKYIDHDFIKNYTNGWEEFKDALLSYSEKRDPSNDMKFFTLEWAAEKTGISAENIIRISHLFGSTKPASIELGMHGVSHHANGDVSSILMTALCLITGNIDTPGGLVFIDSQKPRRGDKAAGKDFLEKVVGRNIDGSEVSDKLSGLHKDLFGDFPAAWKGVLADLPQKIRDGIKLKHGVFKDYSYPVKAFITRAGNPVMTAGSTPDWIDALTLKNDLLPLPFDEGEGAGLKPAPTDEGESLSRYQLELIVFIDTHISETGKYADIILPEAGYLERMGVSDVYTMSPEIAIRDQVIKPLYEARTPFEIMLTLSEALVRNGDPDVRAEDFGRRYNEEEDFINELLAETPGYYNVGEPLPYPDLPEGCLITGAPDNPTAVWGKKLLKQGEPLTVDWLRKHNGAAVWPASYYRHRKSTGASSGVYPKTGSGKFEFKFGYLENSNRRLGTGFPTTFYWRDCKWNPKNSQYKQISREYPFQLITGRVHHSMTMTAVCPYLAETETECMKRLDEGGSIPVLAVNNSDGERLGVKNGDVIALETPFKKRVSGKVFLTEEVMPGVIKTAFGPGGQKASGPGFINNVSEYIPNINECLDPDNLSPFTGMPGFGDVMVRMIKEVES
ncbi:MAG: molybdopterin-dependent oxidoreductase [Nitrospirae bacterium]|nr:molybdopterin-dependent oxidoreductase [Nitrospirota bacterium]